jgi:prepilin peptidase CpaA
MADVLHNMILYWLLPALLIYAAFSDLFRMKISNSICLGIMGAWCVHSIMIGMPLTQILLQAGFALIILLVCFALFTTGLFGGGDAKLIAAVAFWLTPMENAAFFLLFSLLGGMLTLAILFLRRDDIKFYLPQGLFHHIINPRNGIPYGIAIVPAAMIQIYSGIL